MKNLYKEQYLEQWVVDVDSEWNKMGCMTEGAC